MGKSVSNIRNSPFCGKDGYIYYSTDHQVISRYNTQKNKCDKMVKFPSKTNVCSYTHYNGCIYFISSNGSDIIKYDIINDKWQQIKNVIQKSLFIIIGDCSTSITIHDNIHIIGELSNHHIMYNIKENSIQKSYRFDNVKISDPCIVYHDGLNKIFMFGGLNKYHKYGYKTLDSFYCSSYITDNGFIEIVTKILIDKGCYSRDVSKIIVEYAFGVDEFHCEWTLNIAATLWTPLWRCGYILYDKYIMTFGGYEMFLRKDSAKGQYRLTDRITILDVFNIELGWKMLNTECPMEQTYHAVLSADKSIIHLFTRDESHHFTISVSSLISEYFNIVKQDSF